MSWSSLETDYKNDPTAAIHRVVQAMWVASPQSQWELAVFTRSHGMGNLTIYFTPESLGAGFGATPCAQPSREGLSLSVGEAGAWDRLG